MNYQEAIEVIYSLKGNTNVEYIENGNKGCDLAIEALEKQLPTKPILQPKHGDADCFICNATVQYNDEYCHICGQKLDWTDED